MIPLSEIIHKLKLSPTVRFLPDKLGITNGAKFVKIAKADEAEHPVLYKSIDEILEQFHGGGGLRPPLQKYKLAELSRLLEFYKPKTVLELGSGSSTGILANFAANSTSSITSIEENPHWIENTKSILRKIKCENQVKIIQCDTEVSQDYSQVKYVDVPVKSCDLLLVDGPALKKDGYIRRNAVCTNAIDIEAKVIIIDMRRTTYNYLSNQFKGKYRILPSDVQQGNPSKELRYWSIFEKIEH